MPEVEREQKEIDKALGLSWRHQCYLGPWRDAGCCAKSLGIATCYAKMESCWSSYERISFSSRPLFVTSGCLCPSLCSRLYLGASVQILGTAAGRPCHLPAWWFSVTPGSWKEEQSAVGKASGGSRTWEKDVCVILCSTSPSCSAYIHSVFCFFFLSSLSFLLSVIPSYFNELTPASLDTSLRNFLWDR